MNKLIRGRVVPTISESSSWDIFSSMRMLRRSFTQLFLIEGRLEEPLETLKGTLAELTQELSAQVRGAKAVFKFVRRWQIQNAFFRFIPVGDIITCINTCQELSLDMEMRMSNASDFYRKNWT